MGTPGTKMADVLGPELAKVRERRGAALDILETGCIRNADPAHEQGDGWSTLIFAEHVRDYGGSHTSIDLDTSSAAKVLAGRGLTPYARLLTGESVLTLGNLATIHDATFDVILLDSGDDPGLIFREYEEALPMVRPGGLLAVDDTSTQPGSYGTKGDTLVPLLRKWGLPFRVATRWGGYANIDVVLIDVT